MTLKVEFWIVLTQVRSYVFSIQDSVSHRIVNPVWIYNRTDHLFHTTISSHYVLDNTIWLLLLYSHIGLNSLSSCFGVTDSRMRASEENLPVPNFHDIFTAKIILIKKIYKYINMIL